MTSKRLGIVIIALAAVWSLAGLDWFAPAASYAPRSILTVGTAQAGLADFTHGTQLTTNTLEGDPDQYANGAQGDPDQYAGTAGQDSTQSQSSDNGSDETSRSGWIQTITAMASSVYGALSGFRY
jgi:hypothetical protein